MLPPLLLTLFPLLGAGLLLRCVEAAATVGSWPPRASHRASTAFTMAAAVLWAPAPTVSLIDGGRRIKNIVGNVPKDLLGQAGKGIGVFKFLRFYPCRCKLGLDEAEPNMRFLLFVGTKFNLRSCCCSDRVGQIFTGHVFTVGKGCQRPKVCWALVP